MNASDEIREEIAKFDEQMKIRQLRMNEINEMIKANQSKIEAIDERNRIIDTELNQLKK